MSVETVAWAKQQRCGCPYAKAVLLELANWARADGICDFRRVGDIAFVVEVSERTIQRALRRLEMAVADGGLGIIRRVVRNRRDGGQQANCFELVGYIYPDDQRSPPGACQSHGRPAKTPQCVRQSPRGRQRDGGGGDDLVTPYLELESESKNPPKSPPAENALWRPIADNWSAPSVIDLPEVVRDLALQWPQGAYPAEGVAFHQHWLGRGQRRANWAALWAARIPLIHPAVMRASKAGVHFGAQNGPSDARSSKASVHPPVRALSLEDDRSALLRDALRQSTSEDEWSCYLALAAYQFDDVRLRVYVRSEFMRNWVETNFGRAILNKAQQINRQIATVQVEAELLRPHKPAIQKFCDPQAVKPSPHSGPSQAQCPLL